VRPKFWTTLKKKTLFPTSLTNADHNRHCNADRVHALMQAGALDLMAADMCSEDYGLRQQCQWAVGVVLRDAASADCAVIIRSDAFQGLLAAAQEWRPFPPAVEGLAVPFERAFDTVTTVVSADAQRQLVETLSSSPTRT
jgi:hypothetical protein